MSKVLLKYGAIPIIENNEFRTPMEIATVLENYRARYAIELFN